MSGGIPLTVINGGISRLRVKGAAARDSLYDLVNGYVTAGKTIKVRPGSVLVADLTPSGTDQPTVGLTAYKGVFNVFCHVETPVPSGYQLNILVNPVDPTLAIKEIHFAAPFLGFLYVVAEFTDGSVYHYWLQDNGTWQPNTVYFNGDYVLPTVPNGFAFAATRLLQPYATWTPESGVALNDIIEPTNYTGFVYKAIAIAGDSPHTGATEPSWPTKENAQIQEFGDFGTTSSASTGNSSTAQKPGTAITDRYGNAAVFTSELSSSSTASTSAVASTSVTQWQAGTLYPPGSVVKPSTGQGAFINAIPNGDFEAGNDGNWVFTTNATINTAPAPYQGTHQGFVICDHSTESLTMNTFGAVTPGQSVTATAYFKINASGGDLQGNLILRWYDSSNTFLSQTLGPNVFGSGGWVQTTVTGNAPAGAARCRVRAQAANGTTARSMQIDLVSWNLETPAAVSNFLFEAIQADVGTSGSTEPTWPTVEGNTVVDNTVTWKAIGTSIITWQAIPIMKSGSIEPVWPTTVGNAVADGTMSWVCADRRITDPKCPQSKIVAIAASKIFAGDKDIIAFSATANPLDWSSENDAGFLPFGLQTYGAEPVAALGLYRSNLLAFNGAGYQMWQVDEDPANMAFLDASPVGSTYLHAGQPAVNDFIFLTVRGIRSIGIAGASTNLQAGMFGKQIDPLILERIRAGKTPRGLYYPGSGQYWLFFGNEAFVLTMNGGPKDMSWSRYLFSPVADLSYNPGAVAALMAYWTIQDELLYLRMSDLVIRVDESWNVDYVEDPTATTQVALSSTTVLANELSLPLFATPTVLSPPLPVSISLTAGVVSGTALITGFDEDGLILQETITLSNGATTLNSFAEVTDVKPSWTIPPGSPPSGFAYVTVLTPSSASYFTGSVTWQYLDFGQVGVDKTLEGFDMVCTGTVNVSVGYDESNYTFATATYAVSGDTLPGIGMVPMPMTAPTFQFRLVFDSGQYWEWETLNVYVQQEAAG